MGSTCESKNSLQLLLMRHAEGVHQTCLFDKLIYDPMLTDNGVQEAKNANTCLKADASLWRKDPTWPDIVFSSWLVRALETANWVFAWNDFPNDGSGSVTNGVIHVADHVNEKGSQHSSSPIGTVSEQKNELEHGFSNWICGSQPSVCGSWAEDKCERYVDSRFDYSGSKVASGHNGFFSPSPPDWNGFLDWAWQRSDIQSLVKAGDGLIAVVSHGDFMQDLVGEHPDNCAMYQMRMRVTCDQQGKPTGFAKQLPTFERKVACQ